MAYIPYPTQDFQSGYSILGKGIMDAAGILSAREEQQAKMRQQLEEMTLRRAAADLEKQKAELYKQATEQDLAIKKAEEDRKVAADKARLEYLKLIQEGKPISKTLAENPEIAERPERQRPGLTEPTEADSFLKGLEGGEYDTPSAGISAGDSATAMLGAAADRFRTQAPSDEYTPEEMLDLGLKRGQIDIKDYTAAKRERPRGRKQVKLGNDIYLVDDMTGEKEYLGPAPERPTRWISKVDDEGNVYQENPETGETRNTGRKAPVKPVKGGALTPEASIETAQNAINVIDQMVGNESKGTGLHPGFSGAVGAKGLSSGFGILDAPIAGTDAADFMALYGQISGEAFLQAREQLKGTGAITDIEGEKAQRAITRMQTSQSEEEFKKAAAEFRTTMLRALGVAKAKQQAAQRRAESTGTVNAAPVKIPKMKAGLTPEQRTMFIYAKRHPEDPNSAKIFQTYGE